MKIVIVNCGNGKDNTLEVVNAFKEHADHHNTTEIIDIGELNISSGGSADEETNTAVSKLIKSDVVVFVSPVSLSKMPAQLDSVLSKLPESKNKMAGIFIIGTAPETDPQYRAVNEIFLKTAEDYKWDVIFSKFYTIYNQNEEDSFHRNYENMCKIEDIGQSINKIACLTEAHCEGPVKYQEDIIDEIYAYEDRVVLISLLWKVENSKLIWHDESSYGMCTCFLNIDKHKEIIAEIMELFKDMTWYYSDVQYSEEKKNMFYRKLLG